LLAAAALVAGFAPARAQDTPVDSRWIAYLGCWESQGEGEGTSSTVCFVPAADRAAVDLVTIENGEVVKAEQFIAGGWGARIETRHGECTGWQSAEWSAISARLYLHMEESCPDWGTRTGTGVIALTRDRQLLYIQGSTVGMKTGVRAQRYREATIDLVVPSEVKDALTLDLDLRAIAQAHAAAAAPLGVDDIVEVSRQLDTDVVEALLVERGGPFTVDAERLVALADARVPSRITDLLIALSYPEAFTLDDARPGVRRVDAGESYAGVMYPVTPWYGSCVMEYVQSPYSSPYCDGFARLYPYGYEWYARDYPVVIVYSGGSGGGSGGSGGSSRPHGRVVNGQGYQEGIGANADVRHAEPRPLADTGASSVRGTSTPSSSSSSGSGEQRTAKPRP
jgi:hypothetical protein